MSVKANLEAWETVRAPVKVNLEEWEKPGVSVLVRVNQEESGKVMAFVLVRVKVSLEEMENLKESGKVLAKVRVRAEPWPAEKEKAWVYRQGQESERERRRLGPNLPPSAAGPEQMVRAKEGVPRERVPARRRG